MITEQIITLRKQLKSKLEPMRFEHSVSVSFTCTALAMRYGYDIQKAELAGLLHDCAKRFTDSELIRKCQKHGVALTEAEIKAPAVIHAKYGAYLAENKYGIQDPEIISAIACHTTGKPAMTLLEKIIYISDYIEPMRNKASNLEEVRKMAFVDLDETLFKILSDTLVYLEKSSKKMDPMTMQTYEYYRKQRDSAK